MPENAPTATIQPSDDTHLRIAAWEQYVDGRGKTQTPMTAFADGWAAALAAHGVQVVEQPAPQEFGWATDGWSEA